MLYICVGFGESRPYDVKTTKNTIKMIKNSCYESPDIFVENFVCEAGFSVSFVDFDNAWGDEFEDTYSTPSSYEAFFYGNINE